MRIWSAVCGAIGVASTCAEVGHSLVSISSENAPAQGANGVCDDWTTWIPPSTEPAIVMQVVSIGFMPMEKNFIRLMEANSRFSRDNIYLLCLDKESEQEIAKMGFGCVSIGKKWSHKIHFVWKMRIKVLSCLLEAGHNVILSDSDALWLKDPERDFESPLARGSSIVASRGNFPKDVFEVWGSTFCMGFVLFRAGACMETVLTSMKWLIAKTGDDQKSVNYAVRELEIKWDESSDMSYNSATDFSRGITSYSDECGLNVTLLPRDKYTRYCKYSPITPITVVAHCRAKQGRSSEKTKWMVEADLWDVDASV